MNVDGRKVTLADAIAAFLAKTDSKDKVAHQQELTKFMRWFGGDQPLSKLGIHEVDFYAGTIEASTGSLHGRLEPLKAFLSFAKQQGMIHTNLAVHVRVKKASGKKAGKAVERQERVVHLTPEGHAQLDAELNKLIAMRPKIAEELRLAAADKDLRENAPYEAARNHQAQVEARIRELESVLHSSQIIKDEHISNTRAGIGTSLVVKDLHHDEEIHFTLVSASEVDLKRGKISVSSPIGKALLDRTEGEEIEVAAPQGLMRYRVERIDGKAS